MAKDKTKTGVPNKHLHARISYLQQAATYLALQGQGQGQRQQYEASNVNPETEKTAVDPVPSSEISLDDQAISTEPKAQAKKPVLELPPPGGLPLQLTTHLHQVARKAQIRLHTNIKRSICKICSTVLIEGQTSTKYIENLSRGGRKPHADVLIVKCTVCGAPKRFPVGAQRQQKKKARKKAELEDVVGDNQVVADAEEVAGE